MALIDGYAVVKNGKLLVDTVYQTEGLAKFHYLSFQTGDYDQEDFYQKADRLDWNVEFEKYPEAIVVPVAVSVVTR